MKIIKEYECHYDHEKRDNVYLIRISCKRNKEYSLCIFKRIDKLCETNSVYLNIFNLDNDEFYQENQIEYIEEVEGNNMNLIPVGLVDFINEDIYNDSTLKLKCFRLDNLYRVNRIIENIEKAIRIKYEGLILKEKCESYEKEETTLD